MTKRKIVFVRHAEYDPTTDDISLTDNGRHQARETGAALAKTGMQGALVISSAANRARQTAEEITSQVDGSGPHISEELWFKSMAPSSIEDLDGFLVELAMEAGEDDPSKPLVAVAHAELLSALPANIKTLADIAFCETVEYTPGTWVRPTK